MAAHRPPYFALAEEVAPDAPRFGPAIALSGLGAPSAGRQPTGAAPRAGRREPAGRRDRRDRRPGDAVRLVAGAGRQLASAGSCSPTSATATPSTGSAPPPASGSPSTPTWCRSGCPQQRAAERSAPEVEGARAAQCTVGRPGGRSGARSSEWSGSGRPGAAPAARAGRRPPTAVPGLALGRPSRAAQGVEVSCAPGWRRRGRRPWGPAHRLVDPRAAGRAKCASRRSSIAQGLVHGGETCLARRGVGRSRTARIGRRSVCGRGEPSFCNFGP